MIKVCIDDIFESIKLDSKRFCENLNPTLNTKMRSAITPAERLAVALRYLATGETFHSLTSAYRIGERTISGIVDETFSAIYKCLREEYLKIPDTEEQWRAISEDFQNKWNYPFCLGALDGKHITIRQPPNTGSLFFNYKQHFSVLLLALVDANYRFIYVDVGSTGRTGDAGVFAASPLRAAMDSGNLSFPPPAELTPGLECNYHIIGDNAFPMRKDLLKPYSPYSHRQLNREQRIFNYRFSRARRVVENAFGILANRFRLFLTTICLDPEKVKNAVLAACCLHNFLLEINPLSCGQVDYEDTQNGQVFQGTWRQDPKLSGIESTSSKNSSLSAKGQRGMLKIYFNSQHGRVSWQDNMI